MSDDAFDLFWEASALTPALVPRFGAAIDRYLPPDAHRTATHPGPDVALPKPRDRHARLLRARRSDRTFGAGRLPLKQVGSLCAAFGRSNAGGRAFPSAGGLYPLEVYVLAESVDGLERGVHCYNADDHTLSRVGPLPAWDAYRAALTFECVGVPQVVFVFALLGDDLVDKYGARGGRFALLEVGHAAQNLALRVTAEGLAGCEIGGTLDTELRTLLDIDGAPARIALAFACGLPT